MTSSVPGFPRRGIPFPKPLHPSRREPPKPFFKTASGRRMIFYMFGFLALAGALFKGVGSGSPRAQGGAESRPDSSVALTRAPRTFVSPDVLHQLRTLEDFTRQPNDAAVAAAVQSIGRVGGAEGPPADWTDLDIDQALAHPAAFRGGLVRVSGVLAGIETRSLQHPAVPEGLIYRAYLLCRVPSGDAMVVFETPTPPEFEKEAPLVVEGVFLQAIQYEAKKGAIRSTPFLVAASVRPAPSGEAKSMVENLFVPIVVVLIILILLTTLFLFRKSRKPAFAPDYKVRPPGPGR